MSTRIGPITTVQLEVTFEDHGEPYDPPVVEFWLRAPRGEKRRWVYGVGGTVVREEEGVYRVAFCAANFTNIQQRVGDWAWYFAAPGSTSGDVQMDPQTLTVKAPGFEP